MTVSWALTSCLLIAVVLLLRFALGRNISARLRYALWLVVLVRLLIPAQLITVPAAMFPSASREEVSIAYPVSGGTPVLNFENNEVTGAGELPAASPSSNGTSWEAGSAGAFPSTAALPQILLGIWATGSCAVLLVILFSNLRFARRLRRVRRPMEKVESRLPVYQADGLPSPCLFGLFRPAIYLTEDVVVTDEAVLRHVLVHEETHFRHGDHIWSALRGVALALHWWNPLVWLTVVLSRRDGELACDEGALRHADGPTRAAYGRALIRLVTTKPALTDLFCCATTMTAGKSGLKERIAMIARRPRTLLTAFAAAAFLVGLAVGCTFTGGRSDTWEPLSDEELAWFNGDEFFNGDYLNIRNQFLSSTYENPEDVDLFELFYCGDGAANYADAPEGVDAAELEAAMLAAIGGEDPDCPATILTTARMDAVLEEYLGLTLDETNQVGLDNFTYLPEYDIYYYFHGDTNYRASVTFTSGERNGDLVRLIYDATFLVDDLKEVTLREHGDSWQFVSNLAVEEGDSVPLESRLAALPGSLPDRVVVVEPGDVTENSSGVLASYYYEPDYNTEWGGWMLDVARYTPVEFEQSYTTWDLIGGASYLGRDADWYYVCLTPTDVNFDPEHMEGYQNTEETLTAWLEKLAADIGLTPLEEDLFYQRVSMNLSYQEGEHYTVRYYPYYGLSGYEEQADTVYTLVLSQPVTQGEDGIWCVDRWYDDAGNKHLVIPESDQTMDEYYASLQAACDEGHRPGLLDPMQVALEFEQAYTDRELSLDAFALEGPTDIADTFDLYLATATLKAESPSTALTWLFSKDDPLEFWGHKDGASGPGIEYLYQSELDTVRAWLDECTWEVVEQVDWTEEEPPAGEPPYGNYHVRFQGMGLDYLSLSWESPYAQVWIGSDSRIWRCTSGYDQLYTRLAYLWETKAAAGFPEMFQGWFLEREGDPIPGGEALAAAIDSLSWTPGEPAPEGTEGIFVDSPDHYVNIPVYPGNLVYYYMDDYWNYWFQGTGETDLYALAAEYGT